MGVDTNDHAYIIKVIDLIFISLNKKIINDNNNDINNNWLHRKVESINNYYNYYQFYGRKKKEKEIIRNMNTILF